MADYFKDNICEKFVYKIDKPNKNVRHHKDFNRYNNSPDNLCFMDFQDHRKLHADNVNLASKAYSIKYHSDPEFAEKVKQRLKKGNKTFHNKRNNNSKYKEWIFQKSFTRWIKQMVRKNK